MGLLVCLISFVSGFAASLAAADGLWDGIDPKRVGGVEFLVVVVALGTLSALFGARKHQGWLSAHLKGAVLSGVAGGVLTGVALLVFGVITSLGDNAVVAILLFVARFTFIVWPALILKASIGFARRRALRPARAV